MKSNEHPSQNPISPFSARWFKAGISALLVSAPLFTPLAVLLGSNFGHFDAFKLGKEYLLALLGAGMFWMLLRSHELRRRIFANRLLSLVLVYVVWLSSVAVFDAWTHRVSNSAILFGVVADLRFMAFFAFVYALGVGSNTLRQYSWQKVILIPAVVVVGVGAWQLIQPNFLSHFGYSQHTYLAYETVDNRPEFVRLQSTLRGANPLGAYLVIIISLLVVSLLASGKPWWGAEVGTLLAALVVLFGTYSRSAWIGTSLSLVLLAFLALRHRLSKAILSAGAVLVLLAMAGFLLLRNTYTFQNLAFHTSNSSRNVSSNNQRARALKDGTVVVLKHPLGQGVGSAGPASTRNTKNPALISENYYLQIGQELGWLGLGLFVAIQSLLVRQLWLRRRDPLALALLGSFAGLLLINLLSHAWTDDTLAYVWWGLAAVAVSQPIASNKRKR